MNLSWIQIVRLGLVQMCLGSVVVLCTSTLNRLMVVEYALPAMLPGFLVAFHYGVQISRPHWGVASDLRGRRSFWIILGMVLLASGGFLASFAVTLMDGYFAMGMILSILAYALIGMGVASSGTSLLALLATATAPRRRAAAATTTWLMMIFGIAMTAGILGQFLDPHEPSKLLMLTALLGAITLSITSLAIAGIEKKVMFRPEETGTNIREALKEIWSEPEVRFFTLFVFLSMVAYFMQELILEPYAGLVFAKSLGESTTLSGIQNGGTFLGMITVGVAASALKWGSLKQWTFLGCLGSALSLFSLAALGQDSLLMPYLSPTVAALGYFNGVFAVGAIGTMMTLAGSGRERREGGRMGLWGAAQAIAAGFGGLAGAGMTDLFRTFMPNHNAFGAVFLIEALLFVVAAIMALNIAQHAKNEKSTLPMGEYDGA